MPTKSMASLRAFAWPIMLSTSKSTARCRDSSLLIFSKTWWHTGSSTSSSRNFSSAPSSATSSIGMTVPSIDSGHAVGVGVQPFDGQPDVDVRFRNLAVVEHAPALHQRQFGVGVALLLGVEVPVDLGQRRGGRLLGQRRESARADVLDPAQVGHERLELGPEFGRDGLGAGCVPVDVGKRPLAILDLGQHVLPCRWLIGVLLRRVVAVRVTRDTSAEPRV